MSQGHQKIPGSFILNEHINQNIKEGDDYLMSIKVNKFILPDGTEINFENGVPDGETLINLSLNAYISIESSGEITKLDLFNSS